MPSAQQPDDVEVFTGSTLEHAMSAAVQALGEDLSVTGARKVRRGLPGMKGKEHYEVEAVRVSGADAVDAETAAVNEANDVVDSAFAALLAQAEDAEQRVSAETGFLPPPRRAPHPNLDVVVQPDVPLPSVRRDLPALEPAPVRPADVPAARRPATPAARTSPEAVPAAKATPPRTPAPRATSSTKAAPKTTTRASRAKDAAPKPAARSPRPAARPAKPAAPAADHGWSRRGLAALGVPRAVLAQLPAVDPTSDLGWVSAVEQAVAAVVPAPQTLGPDAPVLLAAYGVAGVVQMLQAAVRTGTPPGVLTLDGGRVAMATPTEIALALRAGVLGGPQ